VVSIIVYRILINNFPAIQKSGKIITGLLRTDYEIVTKKNLHHKGHKGMHKGHEGRR
jgi:hypothetical protein